MVINVNWPYCGQSFTVYTNITSLCCIPGTSMLYVTYNSIKKKRMTRQFHLKQSPRYVVKLKASKNRTECIGKYNYFPLLTRIMTPNAWVFSTSSNSLVSARYPTIQYNSDTLYLVQHQIPEVTPSQSLDTAPTADANHKAQPPVLLTNRLSIQGVPQSPPQAS